MVLRFCGFSHKLLRAHYVRLLRRFSSEKFAIKRVMLEYDSTGEQCDIDSKFWIDQERRVL